MEVTRPIPATAVCNLNRSGPFAEEVYRLPEIEPGSSVVQPIAYWLHPMSYAIMSLPVFVAYGNLRCVCVCVCADLGTVFWQSASTVSVSGA
jgi:hypothetical protein